MPDVIDPETPDSAKSRTGFDGQEYELVFSDEFNTDGRTFYPGDDPYWEAADLWYGSTADQEWYDPKQITTQDGYLRILMEAVTDQTTNHELPYRSGMLQSWNKFCFTSGYIEVSITLPGGPESYGYVRGLSCLFNLSHGLIWLALVGGCLDNGEFGSTGVWGYNRWRLAVHVSF